MPSSSLGVLCFVISFSLMIRFRRIVKLKDHFAFVCEADFMRDFLYEMFVRAEFFLLEAQILNSLFLSADFSLQIRFCFLIVLKLSHLWEKGKDYADQRKQDHSQRGVTVNDIPLFLRTHGAEYRGEGVKCSISNIQHSMLMWPRSRIAESKKTPSASAESVRGFQSLETF